MYICSLCPLRCLPLRRGGSGKYIQVQGLGGQTAELSTPNLNEYIAKASQKQKNASSPAVSGNVMHAATLLLQLTYV